jgi:tRNA-splicing ligase RtcB
MRRVINTEKVPIKLWLNYLEDGAEQQAKNLANMPSIFKHVAIMPDAHQGYGMPIGGVAAFKDIVIPNAVGVDIGCGVLACRADMVPDIVSTSELTNIMGKIREVIPMGFKHNNEPVDHDLMPKILYGSRYSRTSTVFQEQYEPARKQMGTLGGGNHFIEIQRGTDGRVWVMIHSGSRNLGHKIATHWNNVAKDLGKEWHTAGNSSWQLDYLPLFSREGQGYLHEMDYCVKFAKANRQLMMARVKECIRMHFPGLKFDTEIDIAHNYAALEHHYGENVLVHRKGATKAYPGELGIIPGSQGTESFIVRGRGNPESFMSCAHGAGRKMSRSRAKQLLNLDEEIGKLDDLGVVHGMRNVGDLDEAAGAYKDIEEVMRNQLDLVETEVILTPMCVVKS